MRKKILTDLQRFDGLTTIPAKPRKKDCFLFSGSKGYPTFRVDNKTVSATRWILQQQYGAPLPVESVAMHRCDNPRCVRTNKDHLTLAPDRQTNVQDMKDKNRQSRYCNRKPAKRLTEEERTTILKRHKEGITTYRIAKDLGDRDYSLIKRFILRNDNKSKKLTEELISCLRPEPVPVLARAA